MIKRPGAQEAACYTWNMVVSSNNVTTAPGHCVIVSPKGPKQLRGETASSSSHAGMDVTGGVSSRSQATFPKAITHWTVRRAATAMLH